MPQAENTQDEYGYLLRPDSQRRLRNLVVHSSRSILLTTIYASMSAVGLYLRLRQMGKPRPPLTPQRFHPSRILVIRPDLIGDLVMSLTVVHALKRTYPAAEIDLLATPGSVSVVEHDPDVNTTIAYDPNIWRRPKALFQLANWQAAQLLLKSLRRRHYDLAVSVHGEWAAILAVLSGAKRCVGFAGESYPGLMTDPVPGQHWQAGDHLHEVDYCLQLALAAGVDVTASDRVPRLFVEQKRRTEIEQILLSEGWQPARLLIACHVSSNNGQSKRWPIPYWGTLIDRLIREDQANVILTGAPGDLPLIERVLQHTQEKPINLAGKTSLAQLAALLQRSDLLITGDSGPMHIAAAVDTALIAIHGPTDPALSGPISSKATILHSDIWCSPCYTAKGPPADCRFFTTQCMKDITPNQVFNAIHETLSTKITAPIKQETCE